MERHTIQLQENLLWKDMNPVDEATGYLSFYRMAMEDEAITPKQLINNLMLLDRNPERLEESAVGNLPTLCRLSGKSIRYLRRLESVLALSDNVIETVRSGKPNKARAQDFLEDIGDS